MSDIDCQQCGACCLVPEPLRALGSDDYVEVSPQDALPQRDRALLRRVALRNHAGQWHLRVVGDEHRCVALEGTIGERVGCGIYALRPRGCRRVQIGDEECRRARARFPGLFGSSV